MRKNRLRQQYPEIYRTILANLDNFQAYVNGRDYSLSEIKLACAVAYKTNVKKKHVHQVKIMLRHQRSTVITDYINFFREKQILLPEGEPEGESEGELEGILEPLPASILVRPKRNRKGNRKGYWNPFQLPFWFDRKRNRKGNRKGYWNHFQLPFQFPFSFHSSFHSGFYRKGNRLFPSLSQSHIPRRGRGRNEGKVGKFVSKNPFRLYLTVKMG